MTGAVPETHRQWWQKLAKKFEKVEHRFNLTNLQLTYLPGTDTEIAGHILLCGDDRVQQECFNLVNEALERLGRPLDSNVWSEWARCIVETVDRHSILAYFPEGPGFEAYLQTADIRFAADSYLCCLNLAQEIPVPVIAEVPNSRKMRGQKRGPKPDTEAASKVSEIVDRIAPDGDWRSKWNEICEALDAAEVPWPSTWKPEEGCDSWQTGDKEKAIKAINYRLDRAKELRQADSETFS